jgi:hypothetical protein
MSVALDPKGSPPNYGTCLTFSEDCGEPLPILSQNWEDWR